MNHHNLVCITKNFEKEENQANTNYFQVSGVMLPSENLSCVLAAKIPIKTVNNQACQLIRPSFLSECAAGICPTRKYSTGNTDKVGHCSC